MEVYKPRGIVSFDFDAVLHDYHGWDGIDPTGQPIPGAVEFVRECKAAGLTPVIHSCRANYNGGIAAIQKWLRKYDFPVPIEVVVQKPAAEYYIDDRAIRFEGNWDQVREDMKKKPWYKNS